VPYLGIPKSDAMQTSDLSEVIPTRASLLSRLKDLEDQESWSDFFAAYRQLIHSVARKAGLEDAEAQDVVQETLINVAGRIQGFKYDPAAGSFKNWLLLITRRRIADHLRERYRRRMVSEADLATGERIAAVLEQAADPVPAELEAIWNEEWERHLLTAALARVRRRVKPQHYQIFDCYVLKKWPVVKVAHVLGVNVAQVYLAKHRVVQIVKEEITRLETQVP